MKQTIILLPKNNIKMAFKSIIKHFQSAHTCTSQSQLLLLKGAEKKTEPNGKVDHNLKLLIYSFLRAEKY